MTLTLGFKTQAFYDGYGNVIGVAMAVEKDTKGATLRKYCVYDLRGNLLWTKKTDQFIFSIECFSSNDRGTFYFYHPDATSLGVLNQKEQKVIDLKGKIKNVIPISDKLICLLEKNSKKQEVYEINCISSNGAVLWKKEFERGKNEPKIHVYKDRILMSLDVGNEIKYNIYDINAKSLANVSMGFNNEFDMAMNEKNIYLINGTTLRVLSIDNLKTLKVIKNDGLVDYCKVIEDKLVIGRKTGDKYIINIIFSDLKSKVNKSINLPLFETEPPKRIQFVGKYCIIVFPTIIQYFAV